jgi:2-C-methyl-D-erythritol 2,4-cyclodiphosphate synthase
MDATLILAAPKIVPHARAIQEHVAGLLGVAVEDVGIKAKTPEGMGTDNAAIAHVVVLLTKGTRKGLRHAVTATVVPQEEVDSVAEGLIESVPASKKK